MAQTAIGLIETHGLIGVIEAADTAAKAADVRLLGIERIGGGFVSLRFSGDVASVNAAVQAASEAAKQVSELVSAHVIAQPHVDVESMALAAAPGLGPQGSPAEPTSHGSASAGSATGSPEPSDFHSPSSEDLASLSVTRLRQLARRVPGIRLQGRQISRANKSELIEALTAALGSGA